MKNNLLINNKKYEVLFKVVLGEFNIIAYTTNKNNNKKTTSVYFGKYKIGNKKLKSLNKNETNLMKDILEKFNK